MIKVLRNQAGELAVVFNQTGFSKIVALGVDVVAARFKDAEAIHLLPIPNGAGTDGAIRLLIDSLGAVYPSLNSNKLGVVTTSGEIVFRGDKIKLAKGTKTARRTIISALMRQRQIAVHGGFVVHLGP